MRVRDRLVESIDEKEEFLLTKRIRLIRKQIKTLYMYLHKICAIVELCEFKLIWSTTKAPCLH